MNSIKYKELFPLIMENKVWLGAGKNDGRNVWYQVPDDFKKFHKEEEGKKYAFVAGTIWFTNIDHGKRHKPLPLMSESDIVKFSTKKPFEKYENYDAIEVSFVKNIPSDYSGVMGVPISFLSKHSPIQFEIIWQASGNTRASAPKEVLERLKYKSNKEDRGGCTILNGKRTYDRIFIKHLNPSK